MVDVLEGEAENKGGHGYHRSGEPEDEEAGFGFDDARVPTTVVSADEVVQPVT